jgi:hypothetical protein
MENFYGYFHKIDGINYDFRLNTDLTNIKDFKNLSIFNLAIILAEKLRITKFKGVVLSKEPKYFEFINRQKRFNMIERFSEDILSIKIE